MINWPAFAGTNFFLRAFIVNVILSRKLKFYSLLVHRRILSREIKILFIEDYIRFLFENCFVAFNKPNELHAFL